MENTAVNREKQSPLIETHLRIRNLEKSAADILARLQRIGNILSDESGNENEKQPDPKHPEQPLPGIIRDLNEDATMLMDYFVRIDKQVKKIESFI